jgi:cell division septation protein DedD
MSDKDQFTFEEEDDSPKTEVENHGTPPVSDSDRGEILFDTGEELSGSSLGDVTDTEDSDQGGEQFFFDTEDDASEPEQEEQFEVDEPEEVEPGFTADEGLFGNGLNAAFPDDEDDVETSEEVVTETQAKGDGDSRKRTLLMVLLLLIVVAGGAYYFMGLGSSTPSVPTVKIPAEKPVKAVAVPPPPAKAPEEKVVPAKDKPVTVAVPPPVAKPVTKPAPAAKPAPKPVAAESKPQVAKVAVPEAKPAPATPAAEVKKEAAKPAPAVQEAKVATPPAAKKVEESKPAEAPEPAKVPKQVVDGAYALDAGSYLLESNRKALVAKIRKLGYEPLVTPVDATLDMTRLRLGTYSKENVQSSLDFARTIEPGSYSVPAGDGYVIYAGTFLKSRNVEKLKELFLAEGIKVKAEPVQVVRTLSRVRFGSFASKQDAEEAVSSVAEDGLKAVVVKAK